MNEPQKRNDESKDHDEASLSTVATDDSVEYGYGYDDDIVDYDEKAFDDIERNSPSLTKLDLYPYAPDPPLSTDQWIALGRNIGRNTTIEHLNSCADGLDEEIYEIASTENLNAFFSGLANNRSLKFLMLEEYDFSRARLETLRPFVVENDKLADLRIHNCGLNAVDVQMLSTAFSQRRNRSSIKHISLTGPTINDESVGAIVEMCNDCPRLRKLDLGWGSIRNHGCRVLAALLRNAESKLKALELNDNKLGDEGVAALANALAINKRLKKLRIENNSAVTVSGWGALSTILCNTSSIDATYQSNHTLEKMWGSDSDKQQVPNDLVSILQANSDGDKISVAREKIIRSHFCGSFDMSPFSNMDLELLPYVLGLIGKHIFYEGRSKRSAIYRVVRNFPDLCSFPSSDRKRLHKAEQENAALRGENVNLQHRIDQLLLEVEELKSNKR